MEATRREQKSHGNTELALDLFKFRSNKQSTTHTTHPMCARCACWTIEIHSHRMHKSHYQNTLEQDKKESMWSLYTYSRSVDRLAKWEYKHFLQYLTLDLILFIFTFRFLLLFANKICIWLSAQLQDNLIWISLSDTFDVGFYFFTFPTVSSHFSSSSLFHFFLLAFLSCSMPV